MPISIEYEWKQTENNLFISLPFKVNSLQNADIYVSDLVLKVAHAPFLLILDLANAVIPSSLLKRVDEGRGVLHLQLTKALEGHWEVLTFDGSKEKSNERKKASIQRRDDEIKFLHKQAVDKKLEEERETLREQMRIDKKEIAQIEDMKNKEKESAEDTVYESILFAGTRKHLDAGTSTKRAECIDATSLNNTAASIDSTPSVRPATVVKFTHTPRFFKTPMRESTQHQERAFIVKNRPYLKANKYFNTEYSRISDTDHTWLKCKGDNFFKGGDYLAAINAYSSIIEKDALFLNAFMNRSACYLLIEEPDLCLHDCIEALNIVGGTITDLDVSISNAMRTKIYVRMASSYCLLGGQNNLKLSLVKLQNAFTLDSKNVSINADVERIEQALVAYEYKRNADIAFGHSRGQESIEIYSQAIEMDTTLLQAYSNRSAAFLYTLQYFDCIKDCSFVLDELRKSTVSVGVVTHAASIGSIPRPGSELRVNMVKACLARRAIAYEKMKKPKLSAEDWALLSNLFSEVDANER